MRCPLCHTDMYNGKLTYMNHYTEVMYNDPNDKSDHEKKSFITCGVCPNCGHIELVADVFKRTGK